MKKILFIFIFLFINCVYAEDFEIKHADIFEANKEGINIGGNISIKYANAEIQAADGRIQTDADGKPKVAVFFNKARINFTNRKIIADKITIFFNLETIKAEGNVVSEIKDKENKPIVISSDSQEFMWNGSGALANGNLKTVYKDSTILSNSAKVLYKDKKPETVLFFGDNKKANLEQPNNITEAEVFSFDIKTRNVEAKGNVMSTIWAESDKDRNSQTPLYLTADKLFIDQSGGDILANSLRPENKIMLLYNGTVGDSKEAVLIREIKTGKPKKLIFKGDANVSQENKKLSSPEVVLDINEKKLFSSTKENIRPKTFVYKKN